MKYNNKNKHHKVKLFLYVICAVAIFPLFLTMVFSFFPSSQVTKILAMRNNYDLTQWLPVSFIPDFFSLKQYYSLLIEKPAFYRVLYNSFCITGITILGQAIIIPAFCFAITQYRFRGKKLIFLILLGLMLLPFQVTMAPSVIIFRLLGMLNTVWAVILPLVFSPFYIVIVRQYMLSLPKELFEASVADGAGAGRAFFSLVLPLCRPVLGAAVALSFADCWNLLEQPLLFLMNNDKKMPLSVLFVQLADSEPSVVFACSVLYIIPATLIYYCFENDILLGLQLSGLK